MESRKICLVFCIILLEKNMLKITNAQLLSDPFPAGQPNSQGPVKFRPGEKVRIKPGNHYKAGQEGVVTRWYENEGHGPGCDIRFSTGGGASSGSYAENMLEKIDELV
jgi:hypothetical protein